MANGQHKIIVWNFPWKRAADGGLRQRRFAQPAILSADHLLVKKGKPRIFQFWEGKKGEAAAPNREQQASKSATRTSGSTADVKRAKPIFDEPHAPHAVFVRKVCLLI